ncbi:MAG: hypothetical protein CM15mP49_36590 [Actinomycetota bacterium]|nr:MAG: hypothetical protein CM15mP49_36590 [Actinomycetota bacterium]
MITLTESATTKVDELIKDEGEDNLALRSGKARRMLRF